jgi:hypothetical protein
LSRFFAGPQEEKLFHLEYLRLVGVPHSGWFERLRENDYWATFIGQPLNTPGVLRTIGVFGRSDPDCLENTGCLKSPVNTGIVRKYLPLSAQERREEASDMVFPPLFSKERR